jgi:hypothetical protein
MESTPSDGGDSCSDYLRESVKSVDRFARHDEFGEENPAMVGFGAARLRVDGEQPTNLVGTPLPARWRCGAVDAY